MRRKPLRSLDLFSGIGGLTLALRGAARPRAYCDISMELLVFFLLLNVCYSREAKSP